MLLCRKCIKAVRTWPGISNSNLPEPEKLLRFMDDKTKARLEGLYADAKIAWVNYTTALMDVAMAHDQSPSKPRGKRWSEKNGMTEQRCHIKLTPFRF